MKKVGLLNGPNLDRLGKRETEIYGTITLEEIEQKATERGVAYGVKVESFQSNHEGELIDKIAAWADSGFVGLVINPGGLTHTSVALRDAIAASGLLTVEVHISNIHGREEFRNHSLVSGVCEAVVAGMGKHGYISALRYLSEEA